MGTIPPSLPPMYGGHISPLGPTNAELVNTYKALWDEWFDHPTVQSAKALLNYMTVHKAQIEEIARQNPNIMPLGNSGIVPIEKTFSTAVNYLTAWIQNERTNPHDNTIGTSEMLKDLYDWISYAR